MTDESGRVLLARRKRPAWEDPRFPPDVRRLLKVAGAKRVYKYAGRLIGRRPR
jgi:hypothetical protein